MKKRSILWVVVGLNLMVLVALAFIYPDLMISPGPLSKGHADLTSECFSCHTAWRGASSKRCITCHAVADIGLRTSKGELIAPQKGKIAFHQQLVEQDCMGCHSDHQGPLFTKLSRRPFAHDLLQASVKQQCSSCHLPPNDPFHRDIKDQCSQCHGDRSWTPASFDHSKYFVLDRDHQTTCVTCHKNNDYSRYTCYGCHEHSIAKVRSEHLKEGIRNFENCVDCHRDPGIEPEKPRDRGRRERERD